MNIRLGSPRRTPVACGLLLSMLCAASAWAAPGTPERPGYGVTWGKQGHDSRLGIDRMSCWGGPPTNEPGGGCNAYEGDTLCTEARPVLCIRRDDSPRPNYAIPPCNGCVYEDANYSGWIEGHIAHTPPIVGNDIRSVKHLNTLCKESLGDGWEVAKFDAGRWFSGMALDKYYGAADWPSDSPWPTEFGRKGGWGWLGFGNINENTRYWMITIAQPRAHCFPLGKSD